MELKTAKKAWEVQHMKELKEKEQKMLWEDEEELLTYTREDAYNKVIPDQSCFFLIVYVLKLFWEQLFLQGSVGSFELCFLFLV